MRRTLPIFAKPFQYELHSTPFVKPLAPMAAIPRPRHETVSRIKYRNASLETVLIKDSKGAIVGAKIYPRGTRIMLAETLQKREGLPPSMMPKSKVDKGGKGQTGKTESEEESVISGSIKVLEAFHEQFDRRDADMKLAKQLLAKLNPQEKLQIVEAESGELKKLREDWKVKPGEMQLNAEESEEERAREKQKKLKLETPRPWEGEEM